MRKRTRSTSKNRERPSCACRTAGECANTNLFSSLAAISSIRRLISGSRNSGGSTAEAEINRPVNSAYSAKLSRQPQAVQPTVVSYTTSLGRPKITTYPTQQSTHQSKHPMATGYHSSATYPVASTNTPPSAAQSKWTREPSRSIRTDKSQGEPDRKTIVEADRTSAGGGTNYGTNDEELIQFVEELSEQTCILRNHLIQMIGRHQKDTCICTEHCMCAAIGEANCNCKHAKGRICPQSEVQSDLYLTVKYPSSTQQTVRRRTESDLFVSQQPSRPYHPSSVPPTPKYSYVIPPKYQESVVVEKTLPPLSPPPVIIKPQPPPPSVSQPIQTIPPKVSTVVIKERKAGGNEYNKDCDKICVSKSFIDKMNKIQQDIVDLKVDISQLTECQCPKFKQQVGNPKVLSSQLKTKVNEIEEALSSISQVQPTLYRNQLKDDAKSEARNDAKVGTKSNPENESKITTKKS